MMPGGADRSRDERLRIPWGVLHNRDRDPPISWDRRRRQPPDCPGRSQSGGECSCIGPNPACAAVFHTDAVFTGQVMAIADPQRALPGTFPTRRVHLRVTEKREPTSATRKLRPGAVTATQKDLVWAPALLRGGAAL